MVSMISVYRGNIGIGKQGRCQLLLNESIHRMSIGKEGGSFFLSFVSTIGFASILPVPKGCELTAWATAIQDTLNLIIA